MTVVAVPEPERLNDPEMQFCDVLLSDLTHFDEALFDRLANGTSDSAAVVNRSFSRPKSPGNPRISGAF
jgi:hypothetical protein